MFPTEKSMILPLLFIAARYPNGLQPRDAYLEMRDFFPKLTAADRRVVTSTGANKYENNVRWAKKKAKEEGWMRARKGIWFLTGSGWTHLVKEWKNWAAKYSKVKV